MVQVQTTREKSPTNHTYHFLHFFSSNLIPSIVVRYCCYSCLVADWEVLFFCHCLHTTLLDNRSELMSDGWWRHPSQKRKVVPTNIKNLRNFCWPGRLHDNKEFIEFWLAVIASFVRQKKELHRHLFRTPVRLSKLTLSYRFHRFCIGETHHPCVTNYHCLTCSMIFTKSFIGHVDVTELKFFQYRQGVISLHHPS